MKGFADGVADSVHIRM